MFEQASIESSGLLKRPWAITVSFAGQAAAISAVALVSLIHTDSLPRAAYFTGVVAPLGPPPGPTPTHSRSSGKAVAQQAKTLLRVFTAPVSIPKGVSLAGPESVMLSPDDATTGPGVIGGTGEFSGPGSMLLGNLARLLPPPAEPVRRRPDKSPANAPTKQIHVSTGVQAAKLVTQVNPVYPALARQARVAGAVRLTAIIGRDGAIRNLQVMSGHPLLTAAALEAVKQWRYQPTLLNDEPVEVITQIDVNFTLSR
jgi:periplasmic protein TonB